MSSTPGATPILLVSLSAIAGGAERSLAGLARLLPERGYQPHAALAEHGPLEAWLDQAGCPHTTFPLGRLRYPADVVRSVRALRALADELDAGLLIANGSSAHVYAGLAARRRRVPTVWWQKIIPTTDYGGPRMTRPVIDWLAARVPATVVVANGTDTMASQRELTPRRRVVLIETGIDVEAVTAHRGSGAAIRARLAPDGGPLVGIVGWLRPWKGQDVFLRAARLVLDEHPQARFVLVGGTGDDVFAARLRELVDDLGLADRVVFAGHQDDVFAWSDAMDVVVHASWGEAFGQVVVEAMALGKPVVATNRGGPAALVEEGRSGRLVPPGDAVSMARAVSGYLADPEGATRVGAAAAERAKRFSITTMADRMATLFDELLAP